MKADAMGVVALINFKQSVAFAFTSGSAQPVDVRECDCTAFVGQEMGQNSWLIFTLLPGI